MADQPLIGMKKVVVIEDGRIVRMYWEHPDGKDRPIDHDDVIERWKELDGGIVRDYTSQYFLNMRGFPIQNVIRDGVRLTK